MKLWFPFLIFTHRTYIKMQVFKDRLLKFWYSTPSDCYQTHTYTPSRILKPVLQEHSPPYFYAFFAWIGMTYQVKRNCYCSRTLHISSWEDILEWHCIHISTQNGFKHNYRNERKRRPERDIQQEYHKEALTAQFSKQQALSATDMALENGHAKLHILRKHTDMGKTKKQTWPMCLGKRCYTACTEQKCQIESNPACEAMCKQGVKSVANFCWGPRAQQQDCLLWPTCLFHGG